MGENEGQIVNFERICRLCLHEKRTLTDIFESDNATTDNNSFSIDQKIMACAKIDLSRGDGLPSRICIKCLTSVNAAFDFRIQCENADKTLHILHNLLTNETDRDKTDKAVVSVDAELGDVEQTESDSEKGRENVEQVILIKKEDGETIKDHGNYYYIIKEEGDFLEGMLSDAEIVYYDNGSNSERSTTGSTDGKMAMEEEEEEEEMEEEEEEEGEDDEEEEEAEGDEEIAGDDSGDGKLDFELNSDAMDEKRYKVLVKSTGADSGGGKVSQPKPYKKLGDELQKSPCPFCNKLLTRVDEHIRLMHRNKVYICNKFDCGAEFATLKNLQSHQLTCYDVEKAYKCPHCFKEFHRKSNYKAHVRRHNSKKEFQCQLCESAFVDTTGLRRHFLKHHEPEREVFVSNCCGKRFKSKEGLKKHVSRRICGIEVLQVVDPSPIEVPM